MKLELFSNKTSSYMTRAPEDILFVSICAKKHTKLTDIITK